MRPRSIVAFECLALLSVFFGAVQDALGWQGLVAKAGSVAMVLAIQIITFAIIILLVLLVSRRRSRIAKWVLIISFVIGLVPFVQLLRSGQFTGSAIISIVQAALQGIAIVLLFTRDARPWFRIKAAGADAQS